MPARMWRDRIHLFFKLLRDRIPMRVEYMFTFIYLAYSIMTLC